MLSNTGDNNLRSCTTSHQVQVSYRGSTTWLDVGYGTYRAAGHGRAVELRLWEDAVAQIAIGGHTENLPTPSDQAMSWRLMLIWVLAGIGIWAALSGRPRRLLANCGWLILALGSSLKDWIGPIIFFLVSLWFTRHFLTMFS
ncbi:hypothetical protein [Nocardia sp. XZ_19_385]|uniref:hypothetical protein n=1 Tax=Nocardia sp. XZ_19_385 TaxID=2769488 RepID=UPI00188F109D|nr:hypothetical protein [Nocardia sp. XZ_19_385]